MSQADAERFHPDTAAQWRDWLAEHHQRREGVWLVTWRTATSRSTPAYEDIVLEALCWGWIDGQVKTIDDERGMIWMSPRRASSVWAASNKARVERLIAEGRMQPAGQRVIDAAKTNGQWSVLDGPEALIEPEELRAALDGVPEARTHWDAAPPSVRKMALSHIALAKRVETKAARIATIVERCRRGDRPA